MIAHLIPRLGLAGITAAVLGASPVAAQEPILREWEPVEPQPCVVAKVLSANTLLCDEGTEIRLILVAAPDGNDIQSEQARRGLERHAPVGTPLHVSVNAPSDRERRDGDGRLQAFLMDDSGKRVNEAVIRDGWAVVSADSLSPPRYVRLYEALQEFACETGVALWRRHSLYAIYHRPANFPADACESEARSRSAGERYEQLIERRPPRPRRQRVIGTWRYSATDIRAEERDEHCRITPALIRIAEVDGGVMGEVEGGQLLCNGEVQGDLDGQTVLVWGDGAELSIGADNLHHVGRWHGDSLSGEIKFRRAGVLYVGAWSAVRHD